MHFRSSSYMVENQWSLQSTKLFKCRFTMKSHNLKLAICKGHLVAFTYGRIKHDQLNANLYKYDIQSSDDGFEPSAIKPTIHVNHWGTLVSRVPLPLDDSGWLMLDHPEDFTELQRMIITQEQYAELSEDVIQTFLKTSQEEQNYDTHQI